jgi:hypothetical protein
MTHWHMGPQPMTATGVQINACRVNRFIEYLVPG